MANWFKEEITQFGETVDGSIQNASNKIQEHMDAVGTKLNEQRSLTKSDVESLIDYAAQKFGSAIDERIEKAKTETALLVSEKINEMRVQLTDATNEQKRVALRNAMVAILAAIIVGAVSLIYRRLFHGELDLLTVFRAIVLALACGQGIWLLTKFITGYLQANQNKKNLILVGGQYLGAFRVKGAIGHMLLFIAVLAFWTVLNFWPQIEAALHINNIHNS